MQLEELKINKLHILSREDKLEWFGNGEWIDEPDLIQFEYNGFLCKILRNLTGHLCGYVSIPSDHPSYDILYENINIDVHGGLTFSDFDDNKNYFIGFDCGHSGDYIPSLEKLKNILKELNFERYPLPEPLKNLAMFNPTYKNINFCIEECKKIVEQLIIIGKNESTTTLPR